MLCKKLNLSITFILRLTSCPRLVAKKMVLVVIVMVSRHRDLYSSSLDLDTLILVLFFTPKVGWFQDSPYSFYVIAHCFLKFTYF